MCLSDDLPDFLALMEEIISEASFPEDEIERQRALQLADLRAQRERPFAIADDLMRQALYGTHPYRWTSSGHESAVAQFQKNHAADYLSHHRKTGNMAISIFGDVSLPEALALAATVFHRIPAGPQVTHAHTMPSRDEPERIEHKGPHAQTIYLLGFPGFDLRDPDLTAMQIIQSAMSGLSSELGMEVREKRGLVYFVGALQRAGLDPGLFAFYAGTKAEALEELEPLIYQEIERLLSSGLTTEELQRAQEQLVGSLYETLQDNTGLAQMAALNELYGLGFDHAFLAEARIRAVTSDDIRRIANRFLQHDKRVTAIVRPQEKEANPGDMNP